MRQPKQTFAKREAKLAAEDMDEEEQLRQMQRVLANEDRVQIDMWASKMDTLDVQLPEPVPRSVSPFAWASFFTERVRNYLKNAVALRTLVEERCVPNQSGLSKWSPRVFGTQSTSPKSWLAPLRTELLDTYVKVNTAIAAGDTMTLKSLTRDEFLESSLARLRAYHTVPKPLRPTQSRTRAPSGAARSRPPPSATEADDGRPYRFEWKLHEMKKPVKVQSIRTVTGHLGAREPAYGNRYLVNALVTFRSMQTLHVYDRNNKIVESMSQAEPKEVVEHLVFERRFWYKLPWVIKERITE